MKKQLLVFVLFVLSCSARSEHEIGLSYLKINQDLFKTLEFDMDAVAVDYHYWWGNDTWNGGVKLQAARSTETGNSVHSTKIVYRNKINLATTAALMVRYNFSDTISIRLGIGKTDYKSTWTVNGVKPSWSEGTDSDWSYHAELTYLLYENLHLKAGYSDIYRKEKDNRGRETTDYYNIGIIYRF